MFNKPEIADPVWRQVIELESRKETIECWLSNPDISPQLVEVLREMLETTARQLHGLRDPKTR
jgi:hypothetical protein